MSSPPDVMRLGLLAVCVNFVLMLVKIVTGLVGNSYALVADGIESAGDIVSSFITWAGFQLSLRPADDDHPYGHGRFETLAGVFSGAALLAAAALIAWNSVREILTPHHAPAWFTLPVLVLVVLVKAYLSRRVDAAAEAVGSTALKGDAGHHLSDALTSGAAALGIGIALIGGPGWEAADDWGALAACGVIVFNGAKILRHALHDALDGTVAPDLAAAINATAAGTPGVESTEKCRVRVSGTHLLVDIHARVDPLLTVREGHVISHALKARLLAEHARVSDVIVHIEPAARPDAAPPHPAPAQ